MQTFRAWGRAALALTILGWLALPARTDRSEPAEGAASRMAAGANRLGFRLLQEAARRRPGENVLISPVSLALALGMVCNGAEGGTRTALEHALGLEGLSPADRNRAALELRTGLLSADPRVRVALAGSLWARQGVQLRPAFVETNRKYFGAAVRTLDFTSAAAAPIVNGWVFGQTRGRIGNIVRRSDFSEDLLLLLLDTLYFNGEWSRPFDRTRTREGVFRTANGGRRSVPMMTRSGTMEYVRDPRFQAVRLPYGGGRMGMYVFLPEEGTAVEALGAELTSERWQEWRSRFREAPGELTLPRFRIDHEAELRESLSALGLASLFSPEEAELRGICHQAVAISQVRQRTSLTVNEEGTEAAAATSVGVARALVVPFRMVVDRPFLCAIADGRTGALLFLGYVSDPG